MIATKPYLLRAIYDWAEDNGFTPQVIVNAEEQGVTVPTEHVVDGQIILNISSSAVQMHTMDNELVSFSARFSGVEQDIVLPMESIYAIFARENSQGIFFEEMDNDSLDPDPNGSGNNTKEPTKPTALRPKKKSSHLKIIK
ncbi:MAG: ClpXP protease specificity-enhancing factor [Pseudomonadota bacterium]